MFRNRIFGLALIGAGLSLVACSSSRDVEVTGQVSAPASLSIQSEIQLVFYDLTGEDDALERSSVHTTRVGLGDFDETISVEGEKIVVRAIADADEDGACSPGEAWAEMEADIADDDTVSGLALTLAAQPCPAD
jgi:hypothetical protein